MDKNRAWEVLEKLSFVRESATLKELEAAHIIKEECEKMAVDEVVIESFDVPYPVVNVAKFMVTSPEEKEYYVTGLGKSGNTKEQGISGPLAYIHGGQDEFTCDIEGKIVVLTGRLDVDLRKKLVEKGAIGYVSCWGGFYDDKEMKAELPHRNCVKYLDDDSNFPGVMMHLSDVEDLVRSKPEMVKIILQQDLDAKRESRNVVATINGTHPKLKDEIVVFSAHYDSVEFSKGSWDNATGSVTLLELCHYFMENKPARTVKFVWCGSEEIDLNGSYEFCEMHQDILKKIILNINFDMTGTLLGETSVFGCTEKSVVDHCCMLAKANGYYLANRGIGMPSTDATSFALHQVPAISFGSGSVRKGAEIHSRRDTMEHLDKDAFIETCNFAAIFASEVINAKVNIIPKNIPEEVMKKKDYWLKDLSRYVPTK